MPDGVNRLYFASGGRTSFGSANGIYEWKNSANANMGTLDNNGNLVVGGLLRSNVNGTAYLQGGDDATLNDVNVANTVGIVGQQDATR
jgi:hypothetical protein